MEPRAFDLVHERLEPALEVQDIDIYDISPSTVGTFDFVLFTGVLYYARHPLLALERAASVCTDVLVVETDLDAISVPRPVMVFYPGAELKQDPSNWWGPNWLCVEALLRDLGFKTIAFTPTPIPRKWTIFDLSSTTPPSRRAASFMRAAADDGPGQGGICCSAVDLSARIA
ncbi:MAG: hypothetical protein ABSA62_01540 [Methyloceanibacter sp.]|jgi:hypothetical protein